MSWIANWVPECFRCLFLRFAAFPLGKVVKGAFIVDFCEGSSEILPTLERLVNLFDFAG
jgi:hypothetical protein